MSNYRLLKRQSPYPQLGDQDVSDYLDQRQVVELEVYEQVAAAINRALLLPSFRVHRNGVNQTAIVTATQTKIQLDSVATSGAAEGYDDFAYFDRTTNYRYLPLVAGVYQFGLRTRLASAVANCTTQAIVFKNGTSGVMVANAKVEQGSGTNVVTVTCSGQIRMNGKTDYVEFYIAHDAGVNEDLDGAVAGTCAWGCKLADY